MENMVFKCVLTICTVILIIYLLRFIHVIWLTKLKTGEKKRIDEQQQKEEVLIFERRLKLLDKQEEIKKFDRSHELELKKIK